ncbi:PAS domain-containing sensor histidine kinase [Lacinutrix sp. 5H-3-7-4]|uniref:sensor histidine kinase n=1 Tax=Lacinutrix sp. (strain 5H-3-7-4) TaxID=983544 RepID=UPI00020A3A54|nr:HAMP domain-containing sensor histidine kinase [Lacinutrix sp. 5H-3-7-4]AEH00972.1 integral membrane sensor signal transduction histidine kinase [Lacinutrix sp. 5H-3-7-4]
MKLKKLSLRTRIFIAMILLVLLSSILIGVVVIYQYNEETQDYHRERLIRKEKAIITSLDYVIKQTSFEVITEKVPLIFKSKIYEVAEVHNIQINLYDLEGSLLISSKSDLKPEVATKCIDAEILNNLLNTAEHRVVIKRDDEDATYRSSYNYITDAKFKPLAILNLPYLENDDFLSKELDEFLRRLAYTSLLVMLAAVTLAFFLSKYITKSLKTISDKMQATRLEKRNSKIDVTDNSEEITALVTSYNNMIDELEESAVKLATSEREQAWREMAKQVAHEIKNPLTPMRLSVQSFQRKFDPKDENIFQKVEEYSNTLIQQIDTMSSIASAFSNFAKMPAQKKETLNVVKIVDLALDIFSEDYITFQSEKDEIIATLDRTQLIRVVTNLIKNSIQAMPDGISPQIIVTVIDEEKIVKIMVSDNGIGISEENKLKIFEPKFTTKSSGMGLGLAMVKNIVETYKGTITFVTQKNEGTTFTVTFPKN